MRAAYKRIWRKGGGGGGFGVCGNKGTKETEGSPGNWRYATVETPESQEERYLLDIDK
jgi:hypothetical protein